MRVPEKQVVAVHRSPAILGCTFTPPPTLQDTVVTWQTVADQRVLHSFYYGTDQLDRQSPEYKNRTSLYHKQLLSGNASLRLEGAGPRDTGKYLCSVSTSQGTDKAELQLSYAGEDVFNRGFSFKGTAQHYGERLLNFKLNSQSNDTPPFYAPEAMC